MAGATGTGTGRARRGLGRGAPLAGGPQTGTVGSSVAPVLAHRHQGSLSNDFPAAVAARPAADFGVELISGVCSRCSNSSNTSRRLPNTNLRSNCCTRGNRPARSRSVFCSVSVPRCFHVPVGPPLGPSRNASFGDSPLRIDSVTPRITQSFLRLSSDTPLPLDSQLPTVPLETSSLLAKSSWDSWAALRASISISGIILKMSFFSA